MASRALGAFLALAAAAAIVVSIASSAWWAGTPIVDGKPIEAKYVHVGPLGATGCNVGGDGSCKPIPQDQQTQLVGYAALGAAGLATLFLFLLLSAALRVSEYRRGIATASLLFALLAGGGAAAMLVLGPGMESEKVIEVPIGWGTFVMGGGVLAALLASLITRGLEPEPLRLKPSLQKIPPIYEQREPQQAVSGMIGGAQVAVPATPPPIAPHPGRVSTSDPMPTPAAVERVPTPPRLAPSTPAMRSLAATARDLEPPPSSSPRIRPPHEAPGSADWMMERSSSRVAGDDEPVNPFARTKPPNEPPPGLPPMPPGATLSALGSNRGSAPNLPSASGSVPNLPGMPRAKAPSGSPLPGMGRHDEPVTGPQLPRDGSPSSASHRPSSPPSRPSPSPGTGPQNPLRAGPPPSPGTGPQTPMRHGSSPGTGPQMPMRSGSPSPGTGPQNPISPSTRPSPGTGPQSPQRANASSPSTGPQSPQRTNPPNSSSPGTGPQTPMRPPNSPPSGLASRTNPPSSPPQFSTPIHRPAPARSGSPSSPPPVGAEHSAAPIGGPIPSVRPGAKIGKSTEPGNAIPATPARGKPPTSIPPVRSVVPKPDPRGKSIVVPEHLRASTEPGTPPPSQPVARASQQRISGIAPPPTPSKTIAHSVPPMPEVDPDDDHREGNPSRRAQTDDDSMDEALRPTDYVSAVEIPDSDAISVVSPGVPRPRAETDMRTGGNRIGENTAVGLQAAPPAPAILPGDDEEWNRAGSQSEDTSKTRLPESLTESDSSSKTPIPTLERITVPQAIPIVDAPTDRTTKPPVSTAPTSLPPPKKIADVPSGPTPACPQCESPMAWVEEHLRFYCRECRMYF